MILHIRSNMQFRNRLNQISRFLVTALIGPLLRDVPLPPHLREDDVYNFAAVKMNPTRNLFAVVLLTIAITLLDMACGALFACPNLRIMGLPILPPR
jgi:hypothetical protein